MIPQANERFLAVCSRCDFTHEETSGDGEEGRREQSRAERSGAEWAAI